MSRSITLLNNTGNELDSIKINWEGGKDLTHPNLKAGGTFTLTPSSQERYIHEIKLSRTIKSKGDKNYEYELNIDVFLARKVKLTVNSDFSLSISMKYLPEKSDNKFLGLF